MTGGARPAEKGQEEEDGSGFVEVDPTGRFGRYHELLGKGAFKKVYKAFDELEGIEVAWNQVKVKDVACKPEDLERLYSEIHLLKTLKHKNIIKFYASWIDPKHENIVFITEIFTSGNLRQYRSKHKHVDLRAVKNWSRQILTGLLYLHSHDPPVIHRDLKCENIFVNGNQGEVKIGDLGLATILRHTHSAHSVIGTPEFMAPEFYEEEYTELVDIYAFGLCLLEMMTFEYPYSECSNAAQIFKKVVSGIKPASLAKITDPEVKRFIEKCIAKAPERLSAKQLLMDPFLQPEQKNGCISYPLPLPQRQSDDSFDSMSVNTKSAEISAPAPMISRDFKIESQMKDFHTIFIKLKMDDSTGRICNVHFPFDVEVDTSVGVASEMVVAMNLPDENITTIAAMIDSEIQCHVPEWVAGETFCGNYDGGVATGHNLEPVPEDEVAALPTNLDRPIGSFVLERLPSGHKYWCDSPKTSSANSLIRTQSNASSSSSPHIDTQGSHEVPEQEQSDSGLNSLEDNRLKALSSAHQTNSTISTDGQFSNLDPGASTVYLDLSSASSDDEFTQESKSLTNALSSSDNFRNLAYKVPITGAVLTYNGEMSSENRSHYVMEKLGLILAEHQKELDELKERQAKSIAVILQELPPELRRRVLNECKLKIRPEEIPI